MEYTSLTQDMATQILQRKLVEVEAEHYQIVMNLELARNSGVADDPATHEQMEAATRQLGQLELQQKELMGKLGMLPRELVASNGHAPEPVTKKAPRKRATPRNRSEE
jgi:hypothetical protein